MIAPMKCVYSDHGKKWDDGGSQQYDQENRQTAGSSE
jgi:hypothetical protein